MSAEFAAVQLSSSLGALLSRDPLVDPNPLFQLPGQTTRSTLTVQSISFEGPIQLAPAGYVDPTTRQPVPVSGLTVGVDHCLQCFSQRFAFNDVLFVEDNIEVHVDLKPLGGPWRLEDRSTNFEWIAVVFLTEKHRQFFGLGLGQFGCP
jgi:hypothetical protein